MLLLQEAVLLLGVLLTVLLRAGGARAARGWREGRQGGWEVDG